nr:FG-GAP repeat protein [Nitrosomonas sp.]
MVIPIINVSILIGSYGFRLVGAVESLYSESGRSVSSAGDINGDGFDDVMVSAFHTSPYSSDHGSSYVVFGKTNGFNAAMDLSSLDGNNGFRLGVPSSGSPPFLVSNAGDMNGDGFDDVIIGNGSSRANDTASYVVFGRASGFAADINLSSFDGSDGFRLDVTGSSIRVSVGSAGDVNGDGFDDVIIGASGADPNGDLSGSIYVVFGKAVGFDATLDLSSIDGNNGFRLDVAAYDYTGSSGSSGSSVSSAGDVNDDGFDDVIVGVPNADSNGGNSGSSYVVFGKASGFDATLDLSSLGGNDGFRVDGARKGDSFGSAVSSAGDVNNDGFDDLLVGAPDAIPPNGSSANSSYVIFGGDFITGEAVYLGTAGNDSLVGTELAERFEAGDGNDRMSGLGGADIFHGDAGDDTIVVFESDLDFQLVDGGIGTDTLELSGGGINLDLSSSHDRIDGIETINLTGSGDNTWTLTLPDLLSLSGTTDTFTVNGNVGDRVAGLIDGWMDGGVDGGYRIFTNSGTTLRVHLAVRTDVPTPGVISLADLDGNNGFRVDGAERLDHNGRSISDAGDVNGDGFDDVIIGAPFSSFGGGGSVSGSSYVVFGKASGFSATLDLASLDGSNGFRVDGEASFDRSGESVSSAGDVNGDGFDDVIIGARLAGPNGDSSGSSYVVFGKAPGFSAAMDLSSLNGSNGFRLDGTAAGDISGYSVSSAGDVNGDGFDDVIVGAPSAD